MSGKIKIDCHTLPNGYSLHLNGNNYMYFTKEELLEGFLYHVGLEEMECIERNKIKEFIDASIFWKENGKAIKEVVRLTKQVESFRSRAENDKWTIQRLKARVKELKEHTGKKRKKSDSDDDDNDEDL